MRHPTRAAIAVASFLALLAGVFAATAGPASAGSVQTMAVTKTIVGDGGGEFDFELGCQTLVDDGATADSVVEFSLGDGDLEIVTEVDLDTDFAAGVTCWVEELVAEDGTGVSIVVTNDDAEVVAAGVWDEEDLGELVELEFQTELDDFGSYYVDVYNFFAVDLDLCEIGAEYLGISETVDVMTDSPEELEAAITSLLGLLLEADALGVPAEYQEALDSLIGAYVELNNILLTVDYDIELLTDEQVEEIGAIALAGEAAEEALAPGLLAACEAPTPPAPVPTPPAPSPAGAVRARPAFTG